MDNDTELFDSLYKEHYRVIYAYLLGNIRSRGGADTASDLVQETFLRAWRHLAEVRRVPTERRLFWLLAIARNLLRDNHRRETVRVREEEPLADNAKWENAQSAPDSDPVQEVFAGETASALDAAIQNLPDDLREVLILTVMGELNSVEIGKILETPPGTIRWRLSQARCQIAKEMQQIK
jgi:RNA polymerase sigma-70 factor, ECF subfamily